MKRPRPDDLAPAAAPIEVGLDHLGRPCADLWLLGRAAAAPRLASYPSLRGWAGPGSARGLPMTTLISPASDALVCVIQGIKDGRVGGPDAIPTAHDAGCPARRVSSSLRSVRSVSTLPTQLPFPHNRSC
eukprot:6182708-Pleurochrysis_carterae.AAC.5